jgi:nicotinamidase/pyrazinamidase
LITRTDALVVVDVQNDFMPGGSLAVPRANEVIEPLNRALAAFAALGAPIVATRDWHPHDHCSFRAQGGTWPAHCVADTPGAAFDGALHLPRDTKIISKATRPDADAYSGFDQTDLEAWLRKCGVQRVVVGGLATDYCVRRTVEDALAAGFDVVVLEDAIRAVNVQPDDGAAALEAMVAGGAKRGASTDLASL